MATNKVRKRTKIFSLDEDVYNFLQEQENASFYVNSLVYAEIKKDVERMKSKEMPVVDMAAIHTSTIIDAEATLAKEAEKTARAKAWESLDLEVREEIKDMESWGNKWKEIFYPMFASKGSLTLKEVRDWYFANKEGFKL